jgi:hypothetical protein
MLEALVPNPISVVAGQQFEILRTTGVLSGSMIFNPVVVGPNLFLDDFYNYAAGTVTLRVLQIPSTVVIGADFNGSGFVDGADLAILQMNMGITMGAFPFQGDADGDGDVDGDDFLKWQRQVGRAPTPGSASSSHLSANVPEPAALPLLVLGLLSLAATRRWAR